jgi:MFS family permease
MPKLTSHNLAICLIISLGGFTYGFGFAVFVTSIGQPGFYEYFDLDPTSTYTANIIGAVNALFAFGAAMGAIAQGWISDWRGRRTGLAIAASCALVGGALAAGSAAIAMLIVVRILQGFGLGMIISLVPLYLTEVAPRHRRGFLTGLTVMSFGCGYTMSVSRNLCSQCCTDMSSLAVDGFQSQPITPLTPPSNGASLSPSLALVLSPF